MLTVIATLHVLICLFLIGLVLLQDPKNSGAGSVFGGGGSGSLLGATGAVTFLTRLTRYTAIVFGVTCLILSLLSRPNTGSVIDSMPTAPAKGSMNGAAPVNGAAPMGAAASTGAAAPKTTAPSAPANDSGTSAPSGAPATK